MKKFSNISGITVSKEEIVKETVSPEADIRSTIAYLVDTYLKVVVYGGVNPVILNSVSISGVEDFTDAIIGLLKTDDVKKDIKLLEEARNYMISNNFNLLENKLTELNLIVEQQTAAMLSKHTNRIKDILKNGERDMDKCKRLAQTQANKITDGEKAYYRAMTADDMINDNPKDKKLLKEIYDIFLFRSKQLKYKK